MSDEKPSTEASVEFLVLEARAAGSVSARDELRSELFQAAADLIESQQARLAETERVAGLLAEAQRGAKGYVCHRLDCDSHGGDPCSCGFDNRATAMFVALAAYEKLHKEGPKT